MQWIRFEHQGQECMGQLNDQQVQITDATWADVLAGQSGNVTGETTLDEIILLNPVGCPNKIVAIGLNYLDHCLETNTPPPERPLVFTKFTTSICGPGDEITWSGSLTQEVDYEAELAVIIGQSCRDVSQSDALSYVAGYTAANDVSARDLQMGDGQWIRGKSLDTFCPLGPVFVTADEIPDPQALDIRCILNGQTMQESNTAQMIFGVAKLIEFCSASFTLESGDIILTGTPHGVGMGYDPQVWMKDGDEVVIEIEKIGRLKNVCRIV